MILFVRLLPMVSVDQKRLVGLARFAAESRIADLRNDVEYRTLECRSCLNRQQNPSFPFRFTINPYRGCEFGCAYCYARTTHEWLDLVPEEDGREFERKIFLKMRSAEHLERELASARVRSEPIALGTATDPYQPAERRFGLTRRILEVVARHRDLDFSITTKSDLVLRDLDLLRRIAERSRLRVNVTVAMVDPLLARCLEPRAPTPEKRFSAVRVLAEAGVMAGVFAAPILPLLTDAPSALDALFRAALEARACYVMADLLFLGPAAKRSYIPRLKEQFPHIAPRFAALYGTSGYAPIGYRRLFEARIAALRVRYGLGASCMLEREHKPSRHEQRSFAFMGQGRA